MLAFLSLPHISAIPGDVPKNFSDFTEQLQHFGVFRHSFLLCPFRPLFIQRLGLFGPSHSRRLWPLLNYRKQRIGSFLTIILQLVQPIQILCCFRRAFAQLVEVDTNVLSCFRLFAPVKRMDKSAFIPLASLCTAARTSSVGCEGIQVSNFQSDYRCRILYACLLIQNALQVFSELVPSASFIHFNEYGNCFRLPNGACIAISNAVGFILLPI